MFRCNFKAYCLFSLLNTVIYAVPAGWVWGKHGFLANLGAVDIAGSGCVHLVGGVSGFVFFSFISKLYLFISPPHNTSVILTPLLLNNSHIPTHIPNNIALTSLLFSVMSILPTYNQQYCSNS